PMTRASSTLTNGSRSVLRPGGNRKPRGQKHGGHHALRIRNTSAGDVERRAVIHRRADDWQSKRHVHGLSEGDQLDRNQALIVIAGDDRIEFAMVRTDK